MRGTRILVPTLVAAVLWVGSALAAAYERQHPAWAVHHLATVFAPPTVQPIDLLAPPPWGAVVVVMSTLMLALAYTAALLVVRRASRPAAATALAVAGYWFCAVLAGAVVAAVPAVTEVLTPADGGVGAPSSLAIDQVLPGAQWGLVWGWLPAWVATALDPAADPEPVPAAARAPRGRAAAILAVLVLAAGAVLVIVQAKASDTRNAETVAGESTPTPVPTGEPVPQVAPGTFQIDPTWCTDAQLEYSATPLDAASGARTMAVHVMNISNATCVLEGYPDLAFSDPLGSDLHVDVEHGGATLTVDAGAVRLDLPPGGGAAAELGWRAPTASATEPAGWLYVAAYHGGTRQMVPVDTDITGGQVSTTAWHLP